MYGKMLKKIICLKFKKEKGRKIFRRRIDDKHVDTKLSKQNKMENKHEKRRHKKRHKNVKIYGNEVEENKIFNGT